PLWLRVPAERGSAWAGASLPPAALLREKVHPAELEVVDSTARAILPPTVGLRRRRRRAAPTYGRRCRPRPPLGGGGGPAALPVAVVEEHGSVVRFWLEGLGHLPQYLWEESYRPSFAATSLLHVDSHSDMMLARWDDVQEHMRGHEHDMQRLGAELIRAPAIGDFISGAIFAQLVSDVVWLRSDFASGKYNGPAPGVYEVSIGTDGANLTSVGEEDEVLCFRTLATRFRPEDDTFVNHDHESLDDCGSEGPQHAQTANLSVATLGQLLSGSAGFARPLLAHRDWILDVDLDFFASLDPTVDYFTSRGFSAHLVLQHVQNSLRCPNETQIGDVLNLFRHFERGSSRGQVDGDVAD
ncbi:unnamed protein product, partial [Prorocentrum cordatum]